MLEENGTRIDEEKDTAIFFGKSSIFSNFYPCAISSDGHHFTSAEQLFQFKKAVFAKNDNAAKKILDSTSPSQCKFIGDKIQMEETLRREWTVNGGAAWKALLDVVLLKFSSDPLKSALVNLKVNTIGEASYDKLRGTGIPLWSNGALDKDKWTGKNQLGVALRTIKLQLSDYCECY